MKITYDASTDTLNLQFTDTAATAQVQTAQGPIIQLDEHNAVASVTVPNFMQLVAQGEINIPGVEQSV